MQVKKKKQNNSQRRRRKQIQSKRIREPKSNKTKKKTRNLSPCPVFVTFVC